VRRLVVLLSLVLVAGSASAAPPAAPEGPSAGDVKKAIDAGVAWLESTMKGEWSDDTFHEPGELAILALAHSGVNLKDAVFAKGVAFLEKVQPKWTYRTAMLAMALAEVNPRLYQSKIAHCAQWLVDTQLAEGEWGYPGAIEGSQRKTQGVTVAPPPAPEGSKPGEPLPPQTKIVIQRRGSGITSDVVMRGDFSNTQVAILGLRACREAGIEIPKETWTAALAYLRKYQRKDGGWGYVISGQQDEASYASLTCAAICSVAICANALGSKDPKTDPAVTKALAWLDKHLDVSKNAGIDVSSVMGLSGWQYYHLYSLERAARVLGLERIGKKAWYAEGAKWILANQGSGGRWADAEFGSNVRQPYLDVADTCFALLFLTRATRPITGG
jgi:hypothetical protein